MTKQQARVIVSLADTSMNLSATARKLFVHINTIDYHICRIHQETGKNPKNFYDLWDLLPTALETLRVGGNHD